MVACPTMVELLDAARTRYEQLSGESELRPSRAWELVLVAMRLVALDLKAEGRVEVGAVLGRASLAAGVAVLASGLRASDHVVGVAHGERDGRTLRVRAERRPIDPMDAFFACAVGAICGEPAVLAAVERAVPDIEPDPAFAGRGGEERALFRDAIGAIASFGRGDRDGGRELAARALTRAADSSDRIDAVRLARLESFVLPLLRGIVSEEPTAACAEAAKVHAASFERSGPAADPIGLVAWSALACAALRKTKREEVAASPFLPEPLVRLATEHGAQERPAVSLSYRVATVCARSIDEARLFAALASGVEIDDEALAAPPDPSRWEIITKGSVEHRFEILVDADHAGPRLVDIGELAIVAEKQTARARALPSGSVARAEASRVALLTSRLALELRGHEAELYRDRMSSPLGRMLSDEHPEQLSHAALERLVASAVALDEA